MTTSIKVKLNETELDRDCPFKLIKGWENSKVGGEYFNTNWIMSYFSVKR